MPIGLKSIHTASMQPAARYWWLLLAWLLSLLLFPLSAFANTALQDERYTHILLIPFISLGLVWLEKDNIFRAPIYSPALGVSLLCVGIAVSRTFGSVSVLIFAIVLIWMALFILCFGPRSFHHALFPLMFLLLMVPLPTYLMDKAVEGMQKGSAEVAFALFKLARVPVFRDGFQFSLPGVVIEVAEECSGIRSSLSLLVSSILAGHLFLHSNWRKVCLILLTVPIVIFKNGVRIVSISWLGVYVDHGFLFGKLHKYGGLPFSLVAISLMVLLLFALRKSEESSKRLTNESLSAVASKD